MPTSQITAPSWAKTISSMIPCSLCSRDSPIQSIGVILFACTALNFSTIRASDSANNSRRSEWPTITSETPSCANIGAETSPVYAPFSS